MTVYMFFIYYNFYTNLILCLQISIFIINCLFFPDPVVRSELMGQFPHIVAFCNENGLNNSVQTYMMPILVGYLGAENNQVSSVMFKYVYSMEPLVWKPCNQLSRMIVSID